jgi:hypothetical protein
LLLTRDEGSPLWQTTISPEQARDAPLINMPTDKVKETEYFSHQGSSTAPVQMVRWKTFKV